MNTIASKFQFTFNFTWRRYFFVISDKDPETSLPSNRPTSLDRQTEKQLMRLTHEAR